MRLTFCERGISSLYSKKGILTTAHPSARTSWSLQGTIRSEGGEIGRVPLHLVGFIPNKRLRMGGMQDELV